MEKTGGRGPRKINTELSYGGETAVFGGFVLKKAFVAWSLEDTYSGKAMAVGRVIFAPVLEPSIGLKGV